MDFAPAPAEAGMSAARGLSGVVAATLLAVAVMAPSPASHADDDPAPPPAGGSLEGRVRDEDGAPAERAEIALCTVHGDENFDERRALRAVTDAAGRFAVPGVAAGDVVVRAAARGCVTAWFRGRVHEDGPPLELRVRRGLSVRVRVEDEEGGPIAGATVGLFPSPHVRFLGYPTYLRVDRIATTDAAGACVLTGLAERHYEVFATAAARGCASTGICGGATSVRVVLNGRNATDGRWRFTGLPGDAGRWEPPDDHAPHDPPPPPDEGVADGPAAPAPAPPPETGTVVATVLSAEGDPVPGVRVSLLTEGDSSFTYEFTDALGVATFSPPEFVRTLAAELPDGDSETIRAEIPGDAAEPRAVTLLFASIHSVRVEVRDAQGGPLPGATLGVRGGVVQRTAETGADGRTTLFAARGAPLRIVVLSDGAPIAISGEIAVPHEGPVVLVVPPPRRVTGRAVGPDGVPLFGARVRFFRDGALEDEEARTVSSDDRGEFTADGLLDGRYTVVVRTSAYADATIGIEVPREASLVVRPARVVRVRGRVVGPDGAPVAGAFLEFDGGAGGWSETGDDGAFTVACASGRDELKIGVTKPGLAPREVLVHPKSPDPALVRMEAAPK
jgi:hypothetical protein